MCLEVAQGLESVLELAQGSVLGLVACNSKLLHNLSFPGIQQSHVLRTIQHHTDPTPLPFEV